MRLALRATMALAALALALAAPAARRHELHAAPPAARRLEVDYEGYKKLAMEGNAEALQQKFKHASPEEQLAIKNEILRMRGEKPVELPERKQGGGGGGGGKRLARGSDGKMHDVADPVEAGKEFARRHGMDDDFYATAERDATKSLWEGINDVKEQLLVPALRLPLDDKVTASELREKHMRSPKEFFQENMKGWQVR